MVYQTFGRFPRQISRISLLRYGPDEYQVIDSMYHDNEVSIIGSVKKFEGPVSFAKFLDNGFFVVGLKDPSQVMFFDRRREVREIVRSQYIPEKDQFMYSFVACCHDEKYVYLVAMHRDQCGETEKRVFRYERDEKKGILIDSMCYSSYMDDSLVFQHFIGKNLAWGYQSIENPDYDPRLAMYDGYLVSPEIRYPCLIELKYQTSDEDQFSHADQYVVSIPRARFSNVPERIVMSRSGLLLGMFLSKYAPYSRTLFCYKLSTDLEEIPIMARSIYHENQYRSVSTPEFERYWLEACPTRDEFTLVISINKDYKIYTYEPVFDSTGKNIKLLNLKSKSGWENFDRVPCCSYDTMGTFHFSIEEISS